MIHHSITGSIWTVLTLATFSTTSPLPNHHSSLFKRYPYLDWIRSPTPLNVYPKIFQQIIPRDTGKIKKANVDERFAIPWKLIHQGLKRSLNNDQAEEVKKMWLPPKNQNEKSGETNVGPPDQVNGFRKRLRKHMMKNRKSLKERANYLFFLTKKPVIGKRGKRRLGMIQTANIFEDENFSYPSKNNSQHPMLDKLSQKLCFYIIQNSPKKFRSLCGKRSRIKPTFQCRCSADNSGENTKRQGRGQDHLDQGTGKKFRKIFVRI